MARTKKSPQIRPAKEIKKSSMPLAPDAFVRAVSKTLLPLADPALRPWMQAYMRDQFEFLGVKTPVRRAAVAELIRMQKGADAAVLLRSARLLWALPQREYQFVAVDLLARHVNALSPKQLPALFKLVQQKSWWDTVDSLAASVIGRVVLNAREEDPDIQREMDKALQSSNLWVRRVAILHQLGWRDQTDSERLFAYALTCGHEKEFFIRKAIGWALRDYARHAPKAVREFLRANRDKLSPLTIREAAKHL
jgi:3-methyladenine DNA glycosylase AlkD